MESFIVSSRNSLKVLSMTWHKAKPLYLGTKNISEETLVPGKLEKSTLNKPLPELPAYEEKVTEARSGLERKGIPPLAARLLAHATVRMAYGYTKETAKETIEAERKRAAEDVSRLKEAVAKELDVPQETRLNLTRETPDTIKLEISRYTDSKGLDRSRVELQNRGLEQRSRSLSRER